MYDVESAENRSDADGGEDRGIAANVGFSTSE